MKLIPAAGEIATWQIITFVLFLALCTLAWQFCKLRDRALQAEEDVESALIETNVFREGCENARNEWWDMHTTMTDAMKERDAAIEQFEASLGMVEGLCETIGELVVQLHFANKGAVERSVVQRFCEENAAAANQN